jgi:tRNA nucleotidyltransferase (CCA-adding enzyme)
VKAYAVGGAVRDELLGLPVTDRDYVVVGANPEEMIARGFKPVGKDFPVFLHPQTREEYALARTERKVGRGYRGFTVYAAPDVTLEQDLERRDLTINAIARDEHGRLIDPFGGAADLERRVLRHVSPAFVEDPVRILRVARFAARFGFSVAPETLALMREMVDNGEADALVPERVWQEFSKGLMEPGARSMFGVLARCGLLAKLLPELALAYTDGRPANDAARVLERSLECACARNASLPERFAVLAAGAQDADAAASIAERMKAPSDCRDLAVLWHRHGRAVTGAPAAPAAALLGMLEGADAFRRPERIESLLQVCECRQFGERGWVDAPYPPRTMLRNALAAAGRVDAAGIAAHERGGREIGERLRRARIAAIEGAQVNARG